MAHEIEQGPDGLYGLCVFGAENSSDSELNDVFGGFGSVEKLHRSKNLVFIRYGVLDSALACFEKLKDSLQFRVRPAKKKPNSDTDNQRFKSNFASTQRHEDMHRRDKNYGDNQGRRNEGGNYNRRVNEANSTRPMPKVIPVSPTFVEEKNRSAGPVAKEVVIGNIHPRMKQHTVYELCNKAKTKPLHIAMKSINRPGLHTMHYAYVYVKTEDDVNNIVESLNNLVLNRHQLVVCSADKLVEEAKAAAGS